MTLTPSTMLSLGTVAPGFNLVDSKSGKEASLDEFKSDKATLVMFICNHCPYVKHVQTQLVQMVNDYIKKGVSFIAINSNDVKNYPEDSPDRMKEVADEFSYPFPYLFDETQEIAKAYEAACTPDFYIFDNELKLVYRGQLDDSRPGNNIPVSGIDIRNALDCILNGNPISLDQKPSVGCNIKWKT